MQLEKILWQRFQTAYAKQRLAHALLLIGPQRAALVEFSSKIASLLVCTQAQKPCGKCQSCHLLATNQHPDLNYLQPDKPRGAIKIEQIRELHDKVFTSSQLGSGRVIIINPAEKMNVAAANALLKLLEEPPPHVNFILIAEQISSIAPTIVSRCQQWRFLSQEILASDYLALRESYTSEEGKTKIFAEMSNVIQGLLDIITNKASLCRVAEKWSSYDINDLLWLLYLIHAQMIADQLHGSYKEKDTRPLLTLTQHFKPPFLFKQLDKINEIGKKLLSNVHVNTTLVLEDFLLGYTR